MKITLSPFSSVCVGGNVTINTTTTTNATNSWIPPIPTITLNGFQVTVSYNCTKTSQVTLAYSLAENVKNFVSSKVLGLLNQSLQLSSQEKNNWVKVEYAGLTDSNGLGSFDLNFVKNSGELFSLKLLCIATDNQGSSIASFTSKDNGANSVVIKLAFSRALLASEKLIIAAAIKTFLNITNQIYTDDGQSVVSTSASGRILQTTSNVTVTILPNYLLTVSDPSLTNVSATITNSSNNFSSIIVQGVSGTSISNVAVANVRTIGGSPALTNQYPSILSGSSSLSFTLSMSTNGTIYAYLNQSNNSNSNTSMSYDSFIILVNANFATNSQSVTSGQSAVFTFSNLTASTSFQLYYYGENQGVPVLRTVVYEQSTTTSSNNSEFLRLGILTILVALLFVILG